MEITRENLDGVRFIKPKIKNSDGIVYTIKVLLDEFVKTSWLEVDVKRSAIYTIKEVLNYFKDGTWVVVSEEKKTVERILNLSPKASFGVSSHTGSTKFPVSTRTDSAERFRVGAEGVTLPHKGLRFNQGKKRFDLVHPWAHEQMVKVLTKGAEKYCDRNWERGMAWSNVIASLKRHLNAIESGEDYDPETGELHAAHIACNAHFLTAYYKIYPQGDDRPHQYLQIPKIGLDIDEVLCNWIGDWCKKTGIETPVNWFFDKDLLTKFEEMKSKGELEDFYLNLQPLIKPEDIPFEPHCYITSRPVDSAITERWLALHGFPARPVYTTDENNSKVDIAKREGIEIFVDDGFHNFKALNQAGICCFLMNAKHNERYDVGYKRIFNLKDLL